jgi:hypothetical protein
MLTSAAGETITTRHVSVAPGSRAFVAPLTASSLVAGAYTVRVRARGANAGASAANEALDVVVAADPSPTGALLKRRSAATGNADAPTADRRFHRNEQITIEAPAQSDGAVTARLLDRAGKPLAIPVAAAVRQDTDGARWRSAHVSLAPLAPGDYLVDISGAAGERALVAFRIVP